MKEKDEAIKQERVELTVPTEQEFYEDIRLILKQAREQAYNSVNGIMTHAYWNVGRRIVEQEQFGERKAQYGSYFDKKFIKAIIR